MERFQPHHDFNCLAYAVEAFAAIPERWLVEARLETTLEQIRLSVPPAFATLTEQDNTVLLRAYVPDLALAAHFLMGLGCDFQIAQPPELLFELEVTAQRIIENVKRALLLRN